MNKQIQELAKQADVEWLLEHHTKLEKFAQLIVQECVRYFNEDYTRNFDVLWREDLSKAIEQHFGIHK